MQNSESCLETSPHPGDQRSLSLIHGECPRPFCRSGQGGPCWEGRPGFHTIPSLPSSGPQLSMGIKGAGHMAPASSEDSHKTNRRGSLGRCLQVTGRWPGLTDALVLRRSLVLSLIQHQHARLRASGSGRIDRALSGSTGLAVLAPPWLPAQPQTLGTGAQTGHRGRVRPLEEWASRAGRGLGP